ncbi:hypothetical protein AtubIFM55763_004311 [Aspergillus tubingensis]|nr:hypothetical protein AtubIFM55763_004311 [Aspergillus tubingensis]
MARDVQARLTYLQWQPSYTHTRPYKIGVFAGRRKRNIDRDKTTNLVFHVADRPETIRDIRGLTETLPFDLDTNGFVYKRCLAPTLTKSYEYSNPQKVKDIFLPECEAILKEHVNGADEYAATQSSYVATAEVLLSTDQEEKERKGEKDTKP